jgi:FkbM family methyltransferase
MSAKLRAQIITLHDVLASGHVKDWSVAIDGGAYEGAWAAEMAKRFDRVVAFEPVPANFARAEANLAGTGVDLRQQALFAAQRKVGLTMPASQHSASHYVTLDDNGPVDAVAIDSLDLPGCGLIKLDLEGAELEALRGARLTIKRHSPVLIVEIKGFIARYGHGPANIRALLEKWGYRQFLAAHPDFAFVRDGL